MLFKTLHISILNRFTQKLCLNSSCYYKSLLQEPNEKIFFNFLHEFVEYFFTKSL